MEAKNGGEYYAATSGHSLRVTVIELPSATGEQTHRLWRGAAWYGIRASAGERCTDSLQPLKNCHQSAAVLRRAARRR
ncbi:MAG: hypothetical protein ABSG67_17175 [Thermoguttaceae bacterium]